MQSITGTNLFIHVDLSNDIFELSIAKHANIDMLNSENLYEKRRKVVVGFVDFAKD